MIDFHCHIIYGVDDGAKSLEESLNMIDEAKRAGFTEIILTPHYISEYYETNAMGIKKILEELQSYCQSKEIKLHQASEIYAYEDMASLLEQKKASNIGNTRYVLFELPRNNEILDISPMIYNLLEHKYIPVIAHPERYSYIQKNPNKVISWIEDGALLQANFASIIGIYGKDAKNTLIKMLKHDMIHFFGTDCHRQQSIYLKMPEILSELKKVLSENEIYKLTTKNAEEILNGNILEVPEPQIIKESFFGKIFK